MSGFSSNPTNQHHSTPHHPQHGSILKGGENKKQKIIKWDEETIAEHDKERGTRQKIDEAPTPFRYLSESDQSEAESGSDGEFLRKSKNNTEKYGQSILFDSWEEVNAKLYYEKQLRSTEADAMEVDYSEFGEHVNALTSFPKPSLRKTTSYDTEEVPPVVSPGGRTHNKRNSKSVHISQPADLTDLAPKPSFPTNTNDHLFAGINGSISGGCGDMNTSFGSPEHGELHKEEFKNKRAGHYNEFKMLQAMRAKLAAEEDEDD